VLYYAGNMTLCINHVHYNMYRYLKLLTLNFTCVSFHVTLVYVYIHMFACSVTIESQGLVVIFERINKFNTLVLGIVNRCTFSITHMHTYQPSRNFREYTGKLGCIPVSRKLFVNPGKLCACAQTGHTHVWPARRVYRARAHRDT
jgi:hypothetical protein